MADDNDDVLDAQPDTGIEDVENQVQQTQVAESQAMQQGDYATAHDLASQADFALTQAGDGVDPNLATAVQNEDSATDWAAWNQGIADDNATSAANYAAAGDADHAAEYGAIADDHASTADGYADNAQFEIAHDSGDGES